MIAMKRIPNTLPLLALATLLAALIPHAGAQSQDPIGPDDPTGLGNGDGGGLFDNGLVWGLAGGGLGLLALGGLLYYLGVGGLRHIDKQNVLEHPMRQSLLEIVQEEPGVHLRELANRHGTAVTNTQWHLRKLEMANLVKTQKVQGKRLYYPVEGGVDARQKAFQNAALRNENASRILDYVGSHAGCNQRTLAEALEMNPGTVRWHLRKLEDVGMVRSVPEGAQTRYYPMGRPERPPRPAKASQKESVAVEDRGR